MYRTQAHTFCIKPIPICSSCGPVISSAHIQIWKGKHSLNECVFTFTCQLKMSDGISNGSEFEIFYHQTIANLPHDATEIKFSRTRTQVDWAFLKKKMGFFKTGEGGNFAVQ